jgi:hypothetical protein
MELTEKDWNGLKNRLMNIEGRLTNIEEGVSKLVDEAGKELLTPNEVCKMLKISRNTYQNYVNDKVFEQIRIDKNKNSRVFVKRSEIERLIDEGKI